VLLCLLLTMIVGASSEVFVQAPGPGRADAEAMSRRAAERIRALREEAENLSRQERTLLDELRRLEVERQLKTEELARVEAERTAMAAEMERTARSLAELEAQVKARLPGLKARLV
jgi:septal ring factor EnvC (AmiA/AmiB activator)